LKTLFADDSYQGGKTALAEPCMKTRIIKRSRRAKGFVNLPKRLIAEPTMAWLNGCRRLGKDSIDRKGLAFLRLASIRLMLAKSCNPT
jgi:transposase